MNRGKGRPKGTGRWSEFTDAQIWALIEFIQWRDNDAGGVKGAAQRLAYTGWWHVRDGKYWSTHPAKDWTDDRLSQIKTIAPIGDARERSDEQIRLRYYAAAKRRKTDPKFKASCDWWLSLRKEAHQKGVGLYELMGL